MREETALPNPEILRKSKRQTCGKGLQSQDAVGIAVPTSTGSAVQSIGFVQSAEPGDSGLSSIRVVMTRSYISATTVRRAALWSAGSCHAWSRRHGTHAGWPARDPHDAVVSIETQVRQVAQGQSGDRSPHAKERHVSKVNNYGLFIFNDRSCQRRPNLARFLQYSPSPRLINRLVRSQRKLFLCSTTSTVLSS